MRRLLLIARAAFASPSLVGGRRRLLPALLAIGTACVLAGLTLIWAARLTFDRPVYVSEIGAQGAPTASVFAVALLLIAAGGFSIALASGHVRSSVRWLDRWAPAVSLGFAAVCFVIASQVTCTANCPVPLADPRSTAQDLLHTVSAVLGFAAACFAMLQVAFATRLPRVARLSLVSCVAVAAITILGGMLAIVHVATDVGAWLELVGTTVAILWIAVYSVALARGPVGAVPVEALPVAAVEPGLSLPATPEPLADGPEAAEAVV
ncbi:DUF998 domain-containing protein [Leifsonia sp. F6_8S_P_1B]|uniref:DUF998 domain-containing protein n=1 Tax=Leifsonia williamsii TaxID=3035919 RepID=A0ABT8KD04_9MICO|nr:DUF998 domain-containing protein [Leifsonia williamsii]MDN4614204.1 DUF998 domain-containing protein [Leifsonia williamsii]